MSTQRTIIKRWPLEVRDRRAGTITIYGWSTGLNRFAGPVTIVWGDADRAFTTELGRWLQHAFSNAHLVEVPNARTHVSLDAPGQLADAIAASTTPLP